MSGAAGRTGNLDVVTVEVVRNVLPAIANEMSFVLQRASFNMMIYEVRDYCCSLLDTEGRLLAQNDGGVSHFVADLGVVMRDGLARYGAEGFQPGDVIITNHQRVAGQHLNNIVVYTPCFHDGRLAGFAATRAHWVDVGGLSTGFGAASAVDPWAEGLQLDQIRIHEAGRLDEQVWRLIADNVRYPESSMGDLRSQIAACRLGEQRFGEILGRYGRSTVERAITRVFDQSEQQCRAVVAALPDGVYKAESRLSGHRLDDDEPVVVKAAVTIEGSDMTIDLSGCSSQRRAPINGRTLAAPIIAFKAVTSPSEPVNEGALRPLRIVMPPGSFMMAEFPAPMAAWARALPTVVDTILKALAPAMPDRIPAAHLGVLGGPVVFFGTHPATGQRFVTQSIEGGGWGARPGEDGPSGAVSVCQGDVRNAPIEKMELRWPVRVRRRELRTDSGGPGLFRGGLGIETEIRGLVEGRWTLTDMGRRTYPPWGLQGGRPGRPANTALRLPGQDAFTDVDVVRHAVPAGTDAIIATAGGGGWGDPLLRDPQHVRRDVLEGDVSVAAARSEYGVVFASGTLAVDAAATESLRDGLRRGRGSPD